MKTPTTLLTVIALSTIFTNSLCAQSRTNLINNSGKKTTYDLKASDSLVITEGTFKGAINSFETGARITVVKNAAFEPTTFNNPKGTLLVYGAAKLKDLNTNKGFRLENYAVTVINGALNMNGGEQNFYNYFNATLTIKGDVNMNKDAFLQNEGTLTSLSNFTMNSGSSLVNKNEIAISGNMTVNTATVSNQGKTAAAGAMTFNGSSNITNVCRMTTDGSLTNNSDEIYNSGLLWVSSKKAGNTLTNSGTITSLSSASIKTVNLTNYGTISGVAKIYTTGTTVNTGTMGTKTNTPDSIKFFDASRTSEKTLFDQQYGKVNNNVVFAALIAPDTINAINTCSSVYMSLNSGAVLLPVKWNYFTAKITNDVPAIDWSSDHDAGTVYEVQRSYTNNNFVTVAIMEAADNQTIFHVNDNSADKSQGVIYYRIKGIEPSGEQKFTEIKSVRFTTAVNYLRVSPNPFTSQFTISLNIEKKQSLIIKIYNVNGQLQKNLLKNVSPGLNNICITEAASFSPGLYIIEISNSERVLSTQKIIRH